MQNYNPNNPSAESLIESALNRAKQATEKQIHRVEACTRESPATALGVAVATGYVLRGLPVRALTGLLLRVALVLARPLIFALGAVNLYHFLKGQSGSSAVEEYTPGETDKHPE